MLVDDVTIKIKAGDGGNGAVSLKRSAQTPKGGPDGGNGGNGGNVFFQGTNDINALNEFRYKKIIKAEDGIPGKKNNLYGKRGQDIIINVPAGTRIYDLTENKIYEIEDEITRIILAKGGKGGRGNKEFRTPTNQAPKYAEKGEKGQEKTIRLELRIIADVGFIGLPNAGKSSLLEALTRAHPKIANYPFTTLEPNLGAMDGIILADIPGLIEGASLGRGLGIQFLKHIEKTKLLVHCIDSSINDPIKTYKTVRKELVTYNPDLDEKDEILLLTKIDLINNTELKGKIEQFNKINKKVTPFTINEGKKVEEIKQIIKNRL